MGYKGNSSYLFAAFVETDVMVAEATRVLKNVDYDTMIGTGLSGGLVVPTLARIFGKRFALIRKPGDSNHRERAIEGEVGDRWIFVDDFVSSGSTLNRVKQEIFEAQKGQPYGWDAFTTAYVGTYQYARKCFVPDGGYF